MLHIVLTILKIPLILLALALIILLAAVLLVLFVPVRYQARLAKEEELSLCGRVHWLLHFVSVHADYQESRLNIAVKICGYPLVGGKEKSGQAEQTPQPARKETPGPKAEQAPKPKRRETPSQETAQAPRPARKEKPNRKAEQAPRPAYKETPNPKAEQTPKPERKEMPSRKAERTPQLAHEGAPARETAQTPRPARMSVSERIRGICDKVRNTYRGILEKIRNIGESLQRVKSKLDSFLDLWYDEHIQKAITHGKREIFYVLKHYLPGTLQGRLLFGLSDPAATGQVLGLLCVLQALTGNHLQPEADFERQVLQGDVFLKGHVRLWHLVKAALALLLDAHCRAAFRRVREFHDNMGNS